VATAFTAALVAVSAGWLWPESRRKKLEHGVDVR
jgi:hypothetical protein